MLKDAASAGIYGSRASNGVILITTKKGAPHKGPQIVFEGQWAYESPATKFDLMNGRDYLLTLRPAIAEGYCGGADPLSILDGAESAGAGNSAASRWTTRYLNPGESLPKGYKWIEDPVNPGKIIVFQDNDQQSQWFDDSYWMQYYVGVNGGSDKVTYAASASYMKDGGIGINTDFSRFTFHGNTSFKITKSLTAGTTFDYSETSGNEIPSSGIGNYWTILGRGMFMPATHRDYLEDGQPGQGTNSTTISAAWFDRYYTNNYVTRRSTANFNLKWDIVDGLSAFAQIANHNYRERLDFPGNREFESVAESFNDMAAKLDEYRRSSLDDLMTAKTRIEAIVNSLHEPIIGLDPRKTILFMNREALAVLNLQAEVVGRNAAEVALSNDLLRRLMRELYGEKRSTGGEPLKIYADNKESYFQMENTPLYITPVGGREQQFVGNLIILSQCHQIQGTGLCQDQFHLDGFARDENPHLVDPDEPAGCWATTGWENSTTSRNSWWAVSGRAATACFRSRANC